MTTDTSNRVGGAKEPPWDRPRRRCSAWATATGSSGSGASASSRRAFRSALVGVLAVLVALGVGGAATDREGRPAAALQGVVRRDHPRRARASGSAAYAAWRLAQALLDRDDEGNDFEGWAKRGAALAKGLFYAGLSLLAFSFVAGPRGESRDEPEQTARVFDLALRPLDRARARAGPDRLRALRTAIARSPASSART